MMKSISPLVRLNAGLLLLILLTAALPAQAQDVEHPEALIRDSVEALMSQIEGRRDYFAQNPDELEAVVEDNLADVADFRYIGASVMGRYFGNATPQQRSRFVKVFRQSLIDTYAKGLVTFDYREIRVPETQKASRYDDQASVAMEVVGVDGTIYPVSYTMRLDDGQWKVVNVIVNGINLGLTFRNQFDEAMRQHNRDYDAVIDGWSPQLDVEELEEGE
ncbi:MlaC/ttg2D family ABC transporter substrate-binding protein [Halomonas elongata]|uniref:ABC transporter substrate-binding protein n=1 Tax=Halomonas elongata (strain ATCC 33173 / DSM 2581 / NBRC 15536 / NCIMB 2198 / 1H9) TaxID=768066 RepID=E1V9I2_HALED|nr:ABC transporter substrate-binding protein [Halomonas elongata]MDL4863189.1 ABC transporter substrate-binding protein [Halomonas elongata]RAW07180.1 ABC transporter substrate-binding protein [Halomonas elongata]WBF19060.1 ABC transporter substrate-binding protein [Halomonas elongata]WPU47919.1 ABC transporter substrate-binding protein [Halomonas elongata DSM 2581]WVI72563.1 ABC transporter substrate-binding protein [Halomonas elongata]